MSKRTRMPWDPSHMASQGLELQGLSSDCKQFRERSRPKTITCVFILSLVFAAWQVNKSQCIYLTYAKNGTGTIWENMKGFSLQLFSFLATVLDFEMLSLGTSTWCYHVKVHCWESNITSFCSDSFRLE